MLDKFRMDRLIFIVDLLYYAARSSPRQNVTVKSRTKCAVIKKMRKKIHFPNFTGGVLLTRGRASCHKNIKNERVAAKSGLEPSTHYSSPAAITTHHAMVLFRWGRRRVGRGGRITFWPRSSFFLRRSFYQPTLVGRRRPPRSCGGWNKIATTANERQEDIFVLLLGGTGWAASSVKGFRWSKSYLQFISKNKKKFNKFDLKFQ